MRLLITVLFLAALGPLASAKERVITRDFQVGDAPSLTIDTYRGGITITESDDPVIHVEVHLNSVGDDEKAVQRRLDGVDPQFEQDRDSVQVSLANPNRWGIHFDWTEGNEVDVVYTVSVPRHCSLNLRTVDGGIVVDRLIGTMKARVRTGSIYFKGVDGSVTAQADSGNIIVAHCTGEATLHTDRGDVRLGSAGGRADLKTDFGEIEIQAARAGVVASATAGGISAGFPPDLQGGADLHADGGSIDVQISPKTACSIDASSVWGHVAASVPIQVASGGNHSSHLDGTLNGGGPKLVIRASGGHVTLRPGAFTPAS